MKDSEIAQVIREVLPSPFRDETDPSQILSEEFEILHLLRDGVRVVQDRLYLDGRYLISWYADDGSFSGKPLCDVAVTRLLGRQAIRPVACAGGMVTLALTDKFYNAMEIQSREDIELVLFQSIQELVLIEIANQGNPRFTTDEYQEQWARLSNRPSDHRVSSDIARGQLRASRLVQNPPFGDGDLWMFSVAFYLRHCPENNEPCGADDVGTIDSPNVNQ